MTRVTFAAARRARAELFTRDQVLRGLATRFSCAPAEVAGRDREARARAPTRGTPRSPPCAPASRPSPPSRFPATGAVIAALPGDAELMRAVAAKLVAAGRDALLYAPDAGTVLLMRAAGSTLDCAAIWKQLAAKLGGRGGGKADRAGGTAREPGRRLAGVVAELLPS